MALDGLSERGSSRILGVSLRPLDTFLTVFKMIPCHEVFLADLLLPLLLECSAEIIISYAREDCEEFSEHL